MKSWTGKYEMLSWICIVSRLRTCLHEFIICIHGNKLTLSSSRVTRTASNTQHIDDKLSKFLCYDFTFNYCTQSNCIQWSMHANWQLNSIIMLALLSKRCRHSQSIHHMVINMAYMGVNFLKKKTCRIVIMEVKVHRVNPSFLNCSLDSYWALHLILKLWKRDRESQRV